MDLIGYLSLISMMQLKSSTTLPKIGLCEKQTLTRCLVEVIHSFNFTLSKDGPQKRRSPMTHN